MLVLISALLFCFFQCDTESDQEDKVSLPFLHCDFPMLLIVLASHHWSSFSGIQILSFKADNWMQLELNILLKTICEP